MDLSNKVKILRVIPTLNPASGGPAQHIRLITPYLDSLAVETTVICMDEPSEPYLENLGFKIIAIGKPITPWQFNFKLAKLLKKIIPSFDIVIQHGLWLYPGFALNEVVKKLSSKLNIQLFIYPHGMLDPYYQTEKKRRLKAIRNEIYFTLLEKQILENANALIFTSEFELNSHENSFGKINGPKKLNIGYTSREMNSEVLNHGDNLLFLGRINHKKGLDDLLIAWKMFKTNNKNAAKLIIAGPGWETKYGAFLNLKIKQEKILIDSVIQLDQQDQKQIQTLLNCSKGFILWSKHENFAQTVAESLSAGVPVLISTSVNIYNEVENNKAGFTGEVGWEGALDAITKFYNLKHVEYQNYRLNAKELYSKKFHPASYAVRLKNLFASNM